MSKRAAKSSSSKAASANGDGNRTKSPAKSSGTQLTVLLAIAAGCVVGAMWLAQQNSGDAYVKRPTQGKAVPASGNYPKVFPGYTITGAVPKLQWSPDKPLAGAHAASSHLDRSNAAEMVKRGTPTILQHTLAENWPALKKWTPKSGSLCRALLPFLQFAGIWSRERRTVSRACIFITYRASDRYGDTRSQ